MIRLFLWIAAVVLAAAYLPFAAQVLGYQLAGGAWSALRLRAPYLSQAGDVAAGALGGLVLGLLEAALLRRRRLTPPVAAGAAIGAAHAVYPPLTVMAAPLATALAAFAQDRNPRWVRAQGVAAAWIALALLLPFPRWAALSFLLGAALLSAWGARRPDSPELRA